MTEPTYKLSEIRERLKSLTRYSDGIHLHDANLVRLDSALAAFSDHSEPEGGEQITLVTGDGDRRSITAEYDPSCRLVQFVQYGGVSAPSRLLTDWADSLAKWLSRRNR